MKYKVKITHLDGRIEELDVISADVLGAVVISAVSGIPVIEETLNEHLQLVSKIEIIRYSSSTGELMA